MMNHPRKTEPSEEERRAIEQSKAAVQNAYDLMGLTTPTSSMLSVGDWRKSKVPSSYLKWSRKTDSFFSTPPERELVEMTRSHDLHVGITPIESGETPRYEVKIVMIPHASHKAIEDDDGIGPLRVTITADSKSARIERAEVDLKEGKDIGTFIYLPPREGHSGEGEFEHSAAEEKRELRQVTTLHTKSNRMTLLGATVAQDADAPKRLVTMVTKAILTGNPVIEIEKPVDAQIQAIRLALSETRLGIVPPLPPSEVETVILDSVDNWLTAAAKQAEEQAIQIRMYMINAKLGYRVSDKDLHNLANKESATIRASAEMQVEAELRADNGRGFGIGTDAIRRRFAGSVRDAKTVCRKLAQAFVDFNMAPYAALVSKWDIRSGAVATIAEALPNSVETIRRSVIATTFKIGNGCSFIIGACENPEGKQASSFGLRCEKYPNENALIHSVTWLTDRAGKNNVQSVIMEHRNEAGQVDYECRVIVTNERRIYEFRKLTVIPQGTMVGANVRGMGGKMLTVDRSEFKVCDFNEVDPRIREKMMSHVHKILDIPEVDLELIQPEIEERIAASQEEVKQRVSRAVSENVSQEILLRLNPEERKQAIENNKRKYYEPGNWGEEKDFTISEVPVSAVARITPLIDTALLIKKNTLIITEQVNKEITEAVTSEAISKAERLQKEAIIIVNGLMNNLEVED